MADQACEGMQCSDHPYRKNPGGICAFCLQEKLGKLVSSSKSSDPFFSIPPPLPSSPSSSPPLPDFPSFPPAKNRRLKTKPLSAAASDPLKRSKSVAPSESSSSPRKKSFWSIPSSFISKRRSTSSAAPCNCASELPKPVKEDEDVSPSGSQTSSSFGRKVARSRSVGCGSRSFSGDFLERISNGFGDCTLRRVESHREAKQKSSSAHRNESEEEEERIKERIKCGGIFVGLGMTTYWLSAGGDSVRLPATRPHSRSKSWGWAFASPIRAFRPGGGVHRC